MAIFGSFDEAWSAFQQAEAIDTSEDTSERLSQGRAQALAFTIPVDNPAIATNLERLQDEIAELPGLYLVPPEEFHITLKVAGFQVLRKSYPDDILREEVPRIDKLATAYFQRVSPFSVQLGRLNVLPGSVVIQVDDDGTLRRLNASLTEQIPLLHRYPTDGPNYLPHLTLAQIGDGVAIDEMRNMVARLRDVPIGQLTVRRIDLARAWFLADGRESEPVKSYLLRVIMKISGFEAVIFDMDGVLTDSEPRHFVALSTLLSELGHTLAPEDYGALTGQNGRLTWQWLANRFGLTIGFEEWRDRYDPIIVSVLAEPSEPLPGIPELLSEIRARCLRVGVASTSRSSWVEAALGSLGLASSFDTVVTGDMVEHGKPAPDVFLLAASRLGVTPEACLVIEDSGPGVKAAKAAGMFTVQLRATATAAPPQSAADVVIDHLDQFPLSLFDGTRINKSGTETNEEVSDDKA